MEFIFKETRLTDGALVHDVQLLANGTSAKNGKPVVIFSCHSEKDAIEFLIRLSKLAEKHCCETLIEV